MISGLGWLCDDKGIYIIHKDRRSYLSNAADFKFQYNRKTDTGLIRVISINDTEFDLIPQAFWSLNSFNQITLSKSRYRLTMDKYEFQDFTNILLEMDNGKIIEDTTGIGRIHPLIFYLGNKIIVSGKSQDPEEVVWINNKGYHLELTDKIKVDDGGFSLTRIFEKFHELYGMKAVLVSSFAVATIFFCQLLETYGYFPILYITGDSGRGKSCLADLILQLFGLNTNFASVNISSNSTKVGIEIKSSVLKNLPLAIHEHNKDNLDLIKYRYDGQGSVKYDQNSPDNLNQRQVEGSTIITSVERPLDKQYTSRCVFIDLDEVTMNKSYYEKVRKEAAKLSRFVLTGLENLSFDDIVKEVEKVSREVKYDGYIPRIRDNYCLFAGAFLAFIEKLDKTENFPSREKIIKYIQSEITKAEKMLNPLIYFIREVERIWEQSNSKAFMTESEDYLFFNFNSLWHNISEFYRNKYFPYLSRNSIKKLLVDSEFIEHYGSGIEPQNDKDIKKPITSYPKTIFGKTKRCFVLRKDKLPGYFS